MNKKHINNKTMICLALEEELKRELDKEADKLGITTSAYIRLILQKRVK